jgi:hypothetical protein
MDQVLQGACESLGHFGSSAEEEGNELEAKYDFDSYNCGADVLSRREDSDANSKVLLMDQVSQGVCESLGHFGSPVDEEEVMNLRPTMTLIPHPRQETECD